jgi:hypothetical protein
MSIKRRRLSEMLARVDFFGKRHADVFPPRSTGAQLFAALRNALATVREQEAGHSERRKEARKSPADGAGRVELRTRLLALCRTARSLGVGAPGTNGTFRLPRRGGHHALLTAARKMVAVARKSNGRFRSYGLCLDDVDRALTTFERAIADDAARRRARNDARAGVEAALARAFSIVRHLDAVVTNVLAADMPLFKRWRSARRIHRRRRGARRATKHRAARAATV